MKSLRDADSGDKLLISVLVLLHTICDLGKLFVVFEMGEGDLGGSVG